MNSDDDEYDYEVNEVNLYGQSALNNRFSKIQQQNNISSNNPNTEKFENLFDSFIQANSSKSICKCFENICKSLRINTQQIFEYGYPVNMLAKQPVTNSRYSSVIHQQQNDTRTTRLLYKIIKSKTDYWKANELWKKYDQKANLKDYAQDLATFKDLHVLIIGCGPVGLRLSIECALIGVKCTVVEKRDRFSRNNVLHLWPYTIIDLKNLGAKLFYGKFCAGSIDHISKCNF